MVDQGRCVNIAIVLVLVLVLATRSCWCWQHAPLGKLGCSPSRRRLLGTLRRCSACMGHMGPFSPQPAPAAC